ncbi:S8 family peptidase [Chryseolinea sp. T2]|uniref:S8 family peptidase n=1 Tax=Chryseolinea sp. T2 TaxID=3129255 RepID=UPI003076A7BA
MGRNNLRLVVIVLLCVSAISTMAQTNRYVVFFKNKSGTPYSISNPSGFLSSRAIDRRVEQGITITEQDLPVVPAYVSGVANTGARTFFTSRWANALLIESESALIPSITQLTYVDHVEQVAPGSRLNAGGRKRQSSRAKSHVQGTRTAAQLSMLGLDAMQDAGYRGEKILMALFDGGFTGVDSAPPFQHIFTEGRLDTDACVNFVNDTHDVFQYDDHGTAVFSVIAAYEQGSYVGGSYEANYQLYVTEDVSTEYRIEEYNWLFAAERADSAGVDVISSSLGYYDFDDASMNYSRNQLDGKTTVVSRAAQWAADRGIIVVCSAGNEGANQWQMITAPADAKDVLAVASVTSTGQRSPSSSKGPSADGRIKPDVAAMGVGTAIIRPDGSAGTLNGTSLAAPLITSLAAGVWQRYPSLTCKEVINAIRSSSSQSSSPDSLIGYGIPNFQAVVNYLESHPQEEIFAVYPNPVTADSLIIKPADPGAVSGCRVELLSSEGKIMTASDVSFSWLNRVYTTDLTPYGAGIYFVRITWQDRRYIYRIAKL